MTNSESSHLKSMTAFGRGFSDFARGRLTVEIQSVNRRYLEVNVHLPRQFTCYEIDIRKKLSASLGRGMVNVLVSWKKDEYQSLCVIPNIGLAKGLNDAWKKLAHELKLKEEIPLALLTQEREIFLFDDVESESSIYQQALMEALQKAIEALVVMKQIEGQSIVIDLKKRLSDLRISIASIQEHATDAPEKFRKKLVARLQELFQGNVENEERILHEVAIYAEKVDITEEIVRFISHLNQFEQMLEKPLENPTETRGKKMDFLLQELNRECNTIGTKSNNLETIQHVVTMKGDLEKIREQIQNIE